VQFAEIGGSRHPTHAKSMDLRLSTSKPFNDGTIQIRVCLIWLVLFEYEHIRVYLSILLACKLFMKAFCCHCAADHRDVNDWPFCGSFQVLTLCEGS